MSINKNIVIEDYAKENDFILVQYSLPKDVENKEYLIIANTFKEWLQFENRLDWVLDYCNAGQHEQFNGVASFDDYWENAENDLIMKDLKDYMIAASGELETELVNH